MRKLLLLLFLFSSSCVKVNGPDPKQQTFEPVVNVGQLNGHWRFSSSQFDMLFNSGLWIYDAILLSSAQPYVDPNRLYDREFTAEIKDSQKFTQNLFFTNGSLVDTRIYRGESGLTLEDVSYKRDTLSIQVNGGVVQFDTCLNLFLGDLGTSSVHASLLDDTLLLSHLYSMQEQTLSCGDTVPAIQCTESIRFVRISSEETINYWDDSCTTGTCNWEAHTCTYGYQTMNYILFLGWLCD